MTMYLASDHVSYPSAIFDRKYGWLELKFMYQEPSAEYQQQHLAFSGETKVDIKLLEFHCTSELCACRVASLSLLCPCKMAIYSREVLPKEN